MNLLRQLIEAGESEKVSFAGPTASIERVGQSVCAMLNQQGGTLLWGVDSRGAVRGIANAEEQVRVLNDFLMRHLTPRPLLSVSAEELQGAELVVVEIPPGADKPYALERQIWVRLAKQDLRASADESSRMVAASAIQESRWEREALPGFEVADCNPEELSDARREIAETGRFGISVPAQDEELLRRLYLVRGGQLTNAAMVLFAKDPVSWSPNLALRIVSYSSDKQGRFLHEQTLQGPAVRVLRNAVTLIQQQTGFTGRFKSARLEREDRPAYALFALREGLVNAIVHRDYEILGGQLRVEIFPEHLVIHNPGRLPEGWTEQDILTREESRPTNPDIAQVFHLRGLMERLGIGGRRLAEECRALKAKPPVWKVAKGLVSLTLFRAPTVETLGAISPRKQEFLESLTEGESFKTTEYAEAVDVSSRQARRDLAELEELGIVERSGKGPATVYRQKRKPGHK
jgi:ATP-dependent DNA helicase RecG